MLPPTTKMTTQFRPMVMMLRQTVTTEWVVLTARAANAAVPTLPPREKGAAKDRVP